MARSRVDHETVDLPLYYCGLPDRSIQNLEMKSAKIGREIDPSLGDPLLCVPSPIAKFLTLTSR